ncbi:MAG: AraC family transcriptional regulator [Muribaculaceae bacterium]|nr:AraC family transcriptional regulator [Muribaculaceae bacterium]
MINEMKATEKAQLYTSPLEEWRVEPQVVDFGAIIICRRGVASMRIDFKDWELHEGAVIIIFPGEALILQQVSEDFMVEMLRYDAAMLREASLQLEHTVYSSLRADRCRKDRPVVTAIIDNMFALLKVYFTQQDCTCLDQLVLYQLKAFFTGFYDWIVRSRAERPPETGSRRTRELFSDFMEALERDYRQYRDVAYYAHRLSVTPKYLNIIVQRVTGHTAKAIIDQYVVMQLKLSLRSTNFSVKQLAWDYQFSDTSFFCRYFKQHTGLTPQQYRQSQAVAVEK